MKLSLKMRADSGATPVTSPLAEVAKWKLEAADEDSRRYFYHVHPVESLESGESSIVIGRKGTGKTAICRYFETSSSHDKFCLKLSFKEFPFNLLYTLEDKSFTSPSQYISLWKYFIYNSVLRMMATNVGLDVNFKYGIEKLYPEDGFTYMGSIMTTWTKKSFGASILKFAGNYAVDRKENRIEDVWQDLIPALERLIVNNIDSSRYYIVFDELDEDYRNFWKKEDRERYLSLITSLFKAVSHVRRIFFQENCDIFPIIFLRDDIYELLSDPDKNKWEDHKINLAWKRDSLKKMIAFRLARSRDSGSDHFNFEEEWAQIFQAETMPLGSKRKNLVSSFDYILDLTHSRPRDLVRFLRDAARSSLEQGHRQITRDTIRGVDSDFSNHFREELINEISGLMPDINSILSHMAASHKQRYKYNDFIKYIESYQDSDDADPGTKKMTPITIAQILFHFSILGNAPRLHNRPVFKYQKSHLKLNPAEPLVVHRGLLRTLNLH